MSPRIALALKLGVPALAVAALAFHGLSRLGDGGAAQPVLSVQGPATAGTASAGRRAVRPGVGAFAAVSGSGDEEQSPEPATVIATDDEPTTADEVESEAAPPATDSWWQRPSWWPFGTDKPSEPASPPPPSVGVAIRVAAPAKVAKSTSNALLEFLAISRSGQTMPGDEFSVSQTRDLKIRVWWALNGQHAQRLELLSPDGSLYQRLQTSFDADTAKVELRGNQSYMSVETIVPVAGTWITDHSLFGAWAVNVYLDDDETTSRAGSFTINP
jgi:hypothetical protein